VAATLAHSRALANDDLPEFWQQAKQALASLPDSWLVLIDTNGQQVLNTLRPIGEPLPRRPLREVEQHVIATGQPQVSNVFSATVAQRTIAATVVPIMRDGKLTYFLHLALPPQQMRAVIREQHY